MDKVYYWVIDLYNKCWVIDTIITHKVINKIEHAPSLLIESNVHTSEYNDVCVCVSDK